VCCFVHAGKPLAVCHSASAQGSGEVSAANYEARAFGIRAGMMISDAKGRCPGLLVVPYEFEKYEEASLQVRLPDGISVVVSKRCHICQHDNCADHRNRRMCCPQ
jgi:hypothetical protein